MLLLLSLLCVCRTRAPVGFYVHAARRVYCDVARFTVSLCVVCVQRARGRAGRLDPWVLGLSGKLNRMAAMVDQVQNR